MMATVDGDGDGTWDGVGTFEGDGHCVLWFDVLC